MGRSISTKSLRSVKISGGPSPLLDISSRTMLTLEVVVIWTLESSIDSCIVLVFAVLLDVALVAGDVDRDRDDDREDEREFKTSER